MTPREFQHIDWAGALARLARVQRALEQGDARPPGQLAAIYAQRARRLAQPPVDFDRPSDTETVAVFRLGAGRYAFPVAQITEVLNGFKITPVPGAPPAVDGVIQVRAEIRPLYNLHRQLEIAGPENGESGAVILLRTASRQFGVRVDAVEEIRDARRHPAAVAGSHRLIAWMTDDLVAVLNAGLLADD